MYVGRKGVSKALPGWENNIMGNKYGLPSGLDIFMILVGNKKICPCDK